MRLAKARTISAFAIGREFRWHGWIEMDRLSGDGKVGESRAMLRPVSSLKSDPRSALVGRLRKRESSKRYAYLRGDADKMKRDNRVRRKWI